MWSDHPNCRYQNVRDPSRPAVGRTVPGLTEGSNTVDPVQGTSAAQQVYEPGAV